MKKFIGCGFCALGMALIWASVSMAVEFPPGSVVDVVAEYPSVQPDNPAHDDTAGLQQALLDYAETNRILWLRNGVYTVSDTLAFQGAMRFNTLQGESRDGTIIRLVENAPGFDDVDVLKPVIRIDGGGSADRFQNEIYDLTIETGSGNPGAIALSFISNNQGGLRNLRLVSPQRAHGVGLNLAVGLNGPLLVRDVEVEGFAKGIRTGNAINSATLENVTVRNQGVVGWENIQQVVMARNFISEQVEQIPAIINGSEKGFAQHWFGLVTLVDAQLSNTHPEGAEYPILAVGNTMVLNASISGYTYAARSLVASFLGGAEGSIPLEGPGIVRWLKSYRVLNDTPFFETAFFPETHLDGLGLEVKETPEVPWDDPAQWVNLVDFAVGDGVVDDTAAMQAAIDSMKAGGVNAGKTTLLLPHGSEFRIEGTVEISGPVRRIIGTKGRIRGNGVGRLCVIDAGADDAPILRIERLSGFASQFYVEHRSRRTVAVVNTTGVRLEGRGGGDFFAEDIVGGPHVFTYPGQRVWARQFNVENFGTKVLNEGARLWVLGLKTEKAGTVLETRGQGWSEIYGGLIYRVDLTTADPAPMLVAEDASALVIGLGEYDATQNQTRQYATIARETRAGVSVEVDNSGFPNIGRHNNSAVVAFYSTAKPILSYAEWSANIDWQGKDSSPGVDANQNGFTNFASYAFGLDPVGVNAPGALPGISLDEGSTPPVLVFSHHQVSGPNELVFRVEASTDLLDWIFSGSFGATQITLPSGLGPHLQQIQTHIPVLPEVPRLFLRVVAE